MFIDLFGDGLKARKQILQIAFVKRRIVSILRKAWYRCLRGAMRVRCVVVDGDKIILEDTGVAEVCAACDEGMVLSSLPEGKRRSSVANDELFGSVSEPESSQEQV